MTRLRSERGSVLILVALSTVTLLGIAALSVDASFMFDLKQRLSATADAAAKSAAFEVKRGNSANIQVFAQAEVNNRTGAGLLPAGVSVDAHLCSAAGATCAAPYNTPKFVEVILSSTQSTFFGSILGFANLTPRARAVAGSATPEACFISMNDLELWNATIDATGCSVAVGRNLIGSTPQAEIVGTTNVTGSCSGTSCSGNFNDVTTGQPYPSNPFSTLTPLVPPSCGPATASTLSEGCYTTILDVPNTTFGPGVFFVEGNWDLHNNNSITATQGTLIYLRSTGSITGNQGTLHVTASNTITGYEGIALYGEPGSSMTFTNGLTLDIFGAVALANTTFDSKNHLDIPNTGCNVMVFADFFTKAGQGYISGDNCGTFTNAAYLGVALAE